MTAFFLLVPALAAAAPQSVPVGASPIPQFERPALAPAPTGHQQAVVGNRRSSATPLRRVATANRAATREPRAAHFIDAVQVYAFAEGALFKLYASPERVTAIALERGETLIAVASGDTVRWTVGDTTSGTGETRRTHVLVKPFAAGLATNLLITTDRRAYHLSLASVAHPAMVALSWSYSADALIALKRTTAVRDAAAPAAPAVGIDRLAFGYRIEGDRPAWRPVRAFDDGRQTFIELPPTLGQGEVPPLFVIDAEGAATLVNYRLQGRFYVVDRLFDVAELRLGTRKQQVVRVVREAAAKPRRGS